MNPHVADFSAEPVDPAAWREMTRAVQKALTQRRVPVARLWRWRLQRRVVLVGPMGCGKSTVGGILSRLCGVALLDADEMIARVVGPIPEFFATHGEAAFREVEEDVMAYLLSLPQAFILSSGGGAVLSAATRRRLRRSSDLVVFLDVGEAEALKRVRGGAGRPALKGDPSGVWRRLRDARAPLYHEVADVRVDTTGLSSQDVAWRIVEAIRHPRRSDSHP